MYKKNYNNVLIEHHLEEIFEICEHNSIPMSLILEDLLNESIMREKIPSDDVVKFLMDLIVQHVKNEMREDYA